MVMVDAIPLLRHFDCLDNELCGRDQYLTGTQLRL